MQHRTKSPQGGQTLHLLTHLRRKNGKPYCHRTYHPKVKILTMDFDRATCQRCFRAYVAEQVKRAES